MNISGPAAVAKPEMLFYAPGDLTVTLYKIKSQTISIKADHLAVETYLIFAVQADLDGKHTVFLFRIEVTMILLNDTIYVL